MPTPTGRRSCLVLTILASALFLCHVLQPTRVFAQSESASMSGRVTDQSGAVLPGVEVEIRNTDTNLSEMTSTNSEGFYSFPDLHPGHYLMNVRKRAFRSVSVTNITLSVQDAVARNFALQVGSTAESVTVNGSAVGQLNTETATVSTVVDSQFVENMPLNGRSFQSLIYLIPGVTFTPTTNTVDSGTFSVSGQRQNANYVTVDGASANVGTTPYPFFGNTVGGTAMGVNAEGGTNGLVSVDAMQEFRIQTSSFAPEFGRTPGGQISIVTRGGTNKWHGTAFDYLRNTVFDARNYYNIAVPEYGLPAELQPPEHANDFGGTVGGPIWENHTFFFFSYEGDRLLQPKYNLSYFLNQATVANAGSAWMPFLMSNPVPAATAPYLNQPCDNGNPANAAVGGDIPCFQAVGASQSNPSSANNYSLRLDHNLTKKITVFARYDHAPSYSGSLYFNQWTHSIIDLDTATVGVTYTISPTMVNDLRANVSRSIGSSVSGEYATFGATLPSSSVLQWPAGTGWNAGNAQNNFSYFGSDISACCYSQGYSSGTYGGSKQRQKQLLDTLSKAVGAHQLKFGVDFRREEPTSGPENGISATSIDWAAIQAGTVDSGESMNTMPAITAHMDNLSFFGQDTWKMKPRLTLTYGLRWEINTPPVSDNSTQPLYPVEGIFDSNPLQLGTPGAPLWHTQMDAFAPRVGAAFQIAPNTVVRVGYGLFYDLGYSGDLSYVMGGGAFPWSRSNGTYNVIPLNLTNPAYSLPPFSTTITSTTSSLTAVDPHLRLPVTYEWNAAFERELGKNQTITATYVGAYGARLMRTDGIVPPNSVLAGTGEQINAIHNLGDSHYNSLQLQFMRRMTHGLQALFGYTYSQSRDLGSTDMSGINTSSISSVVLPPLSPSDFNIPNNVSAAISYATPKLGWGGWPGRAVLNGWGLDGIVRHQSGNALSCTMDLQTPQGVSYLAYCDRVAGPPEWIPNATQPYGMQLNPAAFAPPVNPPYGTAGRNSIQSIYAMNQTDLAARRAFDVTERVKLTLRMDYFNLFNHPMFWTSDGCCYAWLGTANYSNSSSFGLLQPSTGSTLNGADNGGQSALYAPGGPRSGQISMKLNF